MDLRLCATKYIKWADFEASAGRQAIESVKELKFWGNAYSKLPNSFQTQFQSQTFWKLLQTF